MRHSGSALDLRLLSSAVGWESIFWPSMTSILSHYTGLAGEVEVWSRRVAIGACLGEEEREEEREERDPNKQYSNRSLLRDRHSLLFSYTLTQSQNLII